MLPTVLSIVPNIPIVPFTANLAVPGDVVPIPTFPSEAI
jgi:hypothetical protein